MLALVCITRAENFRKKTLINYNIGCLKKALRALVQPTVENGNQIMNPGYGKHTEELIIVAAGFLFNLRPYFFQKLVVLAFPGCVSGRVQLNFGIFLKINVSCCFLICRSRPSPGRQKTSKLSGWSEYAIVTYREQKTLPSFFHQLRFEGWILVRSS